MAMLANLEALVNTDADKGMNAALKEQLECPVCLDTCLPPIYMCVNGHNTCNKCFEQVTCCAVCVEPGKPRIRNLFAEQMSSKLKFPCENTDDDCKGMLTMADMKQHLAVCEDQFLYSCRVLLYEITEQPVTYTNTVVKKEGPVTLCTFRGKRSAIKKHVEKQHPTLLLNSPGFKLSADLVTILNTTPTEQRSFPVPAQANYHPRQFRSTSVLVHSTSPRFILAHNQYFWGYFNVNRDKTALVAYVTCIGGKKAASRYKYRVRVASVERGLRSEFTGPVLELDEGDEENKNQKELKFYVIKDGIQPYVENGKVNCSIEILKKS